MTTDDVQERVRTGDGEMANGGYAAQGGEFLLNTTVSGVQTDLSMSALASGGFVSVWTDLSGQGGDASGSGIKARLYDANGVATTMEFLVNGVTAGAQDQPAVTGLSGGGFIVTWTDASATGADPDRTGVKAQMFDASGTRIGAEFLVNSTTQLGQGTSTITSLASGGFVVSWVDASATAPDAKGTGIRAQLYTANGTKAGGEFLVNSTTAGSQQFPAMTSLANGGFVATWVDGSLLGGDASINSVKAQIFSASGAKIGGEFLVNSATANAQDQPVVTSLSNGSFVVVWRDQSLSGDTSGSGLKAQLFDAGGARIGTELLINSTTFNAQDQPSVTAIPGGGFAVSWRDNSNLASDASGFGIKTQVFDTGGAKLGSEFQVNSSTNGNQEMPSIVALASGALVVGWTDYSKASGDLDGGIKAQLLMPTAGAIDSLAISTRIVSETAVENVAVAKLEASGALNASYTYQIIDDSTGGAFAISGNALVVQNSLALDYEASPGVTLTIRATDTFGNAFDKIFSLTLADSAVEDRYEAGPERLGNQSIAGAQQQPAMAGLNDGRYVLVWSDPSGQGGDASGYGIKGQIVAANGTAIGGEFLINTQTAGAQDTPAVTALASGGFVVTWTDASGAGGDASSTGIKAQIYDAAGARVGSETLVNGTTAGAQKAPTVAALSSGGFVISWTDSSQQGGDSSGTSVKAQRFDAAGTRTGPEFLVNSATANAQDTPVVTGLAGGGFVVSWHDASLTGGDASKDSVKAQVYDAAGARIGGEFLVNTETNSNQQQQAITALASGGFAVAWADSSGRGGDLDYFGIKVQLFDASGARVGGELLANSTTAGGQLAPAITTLSTGGFVVSWADYSGRGTEDGTAGIKGQIFTDTGQRVGGEYIVDTQALGNQVDPTVTGGANGAFAIGWTDYSGQGGDDLATAIKLRVFTPLATQGGPPPLVANADSVDGTEDQSLTIAASTLLANDVDTDGLPLTLQSVAAVSGGTVTLNNGSILFTPSANFSGSALFTYLVGDSAGATATGRVTVVVAGVNDAPAAAADQITLSEDGARFSISALLANDVDPDPGDTLKLLPLSATTLAGAALSVTGGNIDYAPGSLFQSLRAGETATDGFSYTIQDASGLTASASVAITVVGANDAPLNLALSGTRVDENAAAGTVVGTLAASDVDHDEVLTYSLTGNAGGRFVVDAATGVVTVASGAVLDYETMPTQAITARATDAGGLFVESAFTLTLNNLPEPKTYTGDNGANTFSAPTNDLWTIYGLSGADNLSGNASSDTIYGGAGADVLDGRGGADAMYGGIGDDRFYVDTVNDVVVEAMGEGSDIVYASSDFTLAENIENLTQLGTADIAATGNSYANTFTGNAGNNRFYGGTGGDLLMGMDGNDMLYGEAGGDFLQGGNGDDILVGGAGSDQLTGGAGADRFVLDTLTVSADRETVKDFVVGEDLFVLSRAVFDAFAGTPLGPMPASAFVGGTAATNADQHLIYTQSTGNLYYDPDGSGAAAMVQIAFLSTKPALSAQNFLIG